LEVVIIMRFRGKNSDGALGASAPALIHTVSVALALALWCFVPAAEAQLPGPGEHDVAGGTTAVFKVTLSPAFGGTTHVVWASGPTCVAESASHLQTADPSGAIGVGGTCTGTPTAGTLDAGIGLPFPAGFNAGGGADEVQPRSST
jgi:hypothetical protein